MNLPAHFNDEIKNNQFSVVDQYDQALTIIHPVPVENNNLSSPSNINSRTNAMSNEKKNFQPDSFDFHSKYSISKLVNETKLSPSKKNSYSIDDKNHYEHIEKLLKRVDNVLSKAPLVSETSNKNSRNLNRIELGTDNEERSDGNEVIQNEIETLNKTLKANYLETVHEVEDDVPTSNDNKPIKNACKYYSNIHIPSDLSPIEKDSSINLSKFNFKDSVDKKLDFNCYLTSDKQNEKKVSNNSIFERLYSESVDLKQKKDFLKNIQQQIAMKECTFYPNGVIPKPHQVNNFMNKLNIYEKKSQQTLADLKRKEDEQQVLELRPTNFQNKHKALLEKGIIKKIPLNTEPVYLKLYNSASQKKAKLNQSQENSNIPIILERSSNMVRDRSISDILYQDAIDRRKRSKSREKSKERESSVELLRPSMKSHQFLTQKFLNEFEDAYNNVGKDKNKIDYIQMQILFCLLKFLKNPQTNSSEKEILIKIWQFLKGPQNTTIIKKNLLSFCLAIFGVRGTYKLSNISNLQNACNHNSKNTKESTEKSICDVNYFSVSNEKPTQKVDSTFLKNTAKGFDQKSQSFKFPEFYIDHDGLFHFNDECILWIQHEFKILYLNALTNIKRKKSVDNSECSFNPLQVTNPAYTNKLAMNHRKRVINKVTSILQEAHLIHEKDSPDMKNKVCLDVNYFNEYADKLKEFRHKSNEKYPPASNNNSTSKAYHKSSKENCFAFNNEKKKNISNKDTASPQLLFEIARRRASQTYTPYQKIGAANPQSSPKSSDKYAPDGEVNFGSVASKSINTDIKAKLSFDIYVTPSKKERISISDLHDIDGLVATFSKKYPISIQQKLLLKSQLQAHLNKHLVN